MSEQPGRYQRTFSGMVGALIATLLALAVFVGFRALTRDELDGGPEPIDYLTQVGYAQEAGAEVIYPASVPEGWVATSVELKQGQRPAWGIGFLPDDGGFVGLRQEDADLDDLLTRYVDEEDVDPLPDLEVSGSVAQKWQAFADEDGDTAYAANVGPDVVLVYGSASREDLQLVLERLTTDPR